MRGNICTKINGARNQEEMNGGRVLTWGCYTHNGDNGEIAIRYGESGGVERVAGALRVSKGG